MTDVLVQAEENQRRAWQIILELKFATPDNEKIMGIAYYMAVLRDGVRDYVTFEEWLKRNPLPGIVDWMP